MDGTYRRILHAFGNILQFGLFVRISTGRTNCTAFLSIFVFFTFSFERSLFSQRKIKNTKILERFFQRIINANTFVYYAYKCHPSRRNV